MRPDIPLKEAVTVQPDAQLTDVAVLFESMKTPNVYVTDESGTPVGVIAPIDIVTKIIAKGLNPSEHTAKDVMNGPVETAAFDKDPEYALAIMMKYKTYACLVTESGKIKGIVEYNDVLRDVFKNMGELDES